VSMMSVIDDDVRHRHRHQDDEVDESGWLRCP